MLRAVPPSMATPAHNGCIPSPSPRMGHTRTQRLCLASVEGGTRSCYDPTAAIGRVKVPSSMASREPNFEFLATNLVGTFLFRHDAQGVFSYVSSSIRDVLGYEPEAFLGHYMEFTTDHPANKAALAHTAGSLRGVQQPPYEVQAHAANGHRRWLSVSEVPVRDDSGGVVAVEGFAQDITERKRTEEALRASINRYERLLSNLIGTFVYRHDVKGVFQYVSPAVTKTLGYSPREFLRHYSDFLTDHPANKRGAEHTELSIRGLQQPPYEIQGRRKDGSICWLRVSEVPVYDEAGEVIAVEGVAHDVTDRKQLELSLRESGERFRQLLDRAGDAVMLHTMDGDIVHTNREAYELLGYTGEELLALKAWDIETDYAPEEMKALWSSLISAGPVTAEGKLKRKDGSTLPVEVRVGPFRTDEGVMMLALARDITERKKHEAERRNLEQQIQYAQKLESLGVLAGGIAHDFNTVLTIILGNVALARNRLPADAPARSCIEEIDRASRRGADLTKQMLAYSGRGHFQVEQVHLGALAEEMLHLLRVSIGKKTSLVCDLAEDLPTMVGDPTQVCQVIMNLITNASEAIGDAGGRINVATGVMDCDQAYLDDAWAVVQGGLDDPPPAGPYVFLRVADTGCGMDSLALAKVFDPFFTTKFTGRGLGMAAVLGIVRGHRGTIRISSKVGKGTTVSVLFPARTDAIIGADTDDQTNQATDSSGTGIVLIVDHDESACDLGLRLLEHAGYGVLTSTDVQESLTIFRHYASEIVCVLLDRNLPPKGGEALLRQLLDINPDARIVLCDNTDEHPHTPGAGGYLTKPFTFAAIHDLLAKPRERDD